MLFLLPLHVSIVYADLYRVVKTELRNRWKKSGKWRVEIRKPETASKLQQEKIWCLGQQRRKFDSLLT